MFRGRRGDVLARAAARAVQRRRWTWLRPPSLAAARAAPAAAALSPTLLEPQ